MTYVDLSLFQIVEGLRYAFPKRMKAFEQEIPGLIELHDRVAERPNIKAYLASERRIAFNEEGIFRRYKELDVYVIPGPAAVRHSSTLTRKFESFDGFGTLSPHARNDGVPSHLLRSIDRRHRQLRQFDAVDAAHIERHHFAAVRLGAAREDVDAAIDAELMLDRVLVEEIFPQIFLAGGS